MDLSSQSRCRKALCCFISELLVVQIGAKFFEENNDPLHQGFFFSLTYFLIFILVLIDSLGIFQFNPSTCGIIFERIILPKVLDYFTNPKYFNGNNLTLDNHQYFAEWKKTNSFPKWFEGCKLNLPKRQNNQQWLYLTSDFPTFLAEDGFSKFDFNS